MKIRQAIAGQTGLSRTDRVAILRYVCNLTTEQVYTNLDAEISDRDLEALERALNERMSGKPLAYITGKREFFSETFAVNESVLIPRPETEILIEEALRRVHGRKDRLILDMGCGSGAIGAIMAKETGSRVVCVDISYEAIRVARKNAESIGVGHLMEFICSDLFESFKPHVCFDMILANLPYVTHEEWKGLMRDVRDFEPRLALDGGEDGLDLYRRLIVSLPGRLTPAGDILLEIGSAWQARQLKAMLEEAGLDNRVINDYANKERVLVGHG
ncbi:MAG: peptide chain release factor N(5)-glutamine methyltransferase [Syntrophorhabdaceae bacterium]|nr:peptide chain release factor N(5)-glutamine methyltransferase [Syntrophorhabdaceae bacterium]MDD4195066.1 peptide chain release factor N(5)-glutamine methyltransferase [Syntrophorhabdaceae bacterium]